MNDKSRYFNGFRSFYVYTVKNKIYSPAQFSSYAFGKENALKKLTEKVASATFLFIKIKISNTGKLRRLTLSFKDNSSKKYFFQVKCSCYSSK
ncbi:hypothetical protein CFB3_38800 [Clostridium folliculivorans]|uniref:Uncharacterized protein n=1 Tax=Clostridium folliculivorans TaxID=2886038 RepID=A0A9W5Y5L4_9CLOT|nr:hypothetical protein CFOLD11_39830 [Clostridium folliculivorans]GKU31773.1 hypothetical protein CFB3_38800 [Clostridium folliculivorans]